MKKSEAEKLVNDTFTQAYDEARFRRFIHELFHDYEKEEKRLRPEPISRRPFKMAFTLTSD